MAAKSLGEMMKVLSSWEWSISCWMRIVWNFNIIYSNSSPSSTGRRWIAKNKKEHLFGDKIHGIIESVDKIIIQKKDWFYGKYGSQCTFSVLDVLSPDYGGEISKKSHQWFDFRKSKGNMGIYCPTVWNCFGGIESWYWSCACNVSCTAQNGTQ